MPDLPAHLWYSITSLGGAGMTLPLAFAIALWLAVGYTWRMAAGWLLLLGAAIGVVTLTKLAFLGWGVGVRELDFTGVSGHAMLSTAVYPVALFLMLLPARPAIRLLGVLLGLAAGMAVGLSRVVLSAHSPSEAVTGCLVGAEGCPIAFLLIGFVWNRALHHQDERVRFALCRAMEMGHEVLSVVGGEEGIIEMDLGNPGKSPQDDVFNAGLGGRRHGDGVPIATETCGEP